MTKNIYKKCICIPDNLRAQITETQTLVIKTTEIKSMTDYNIIEISRFILGFHLQYKYNNFIIRSILRTMKITEIDNKIKFNNKTYMIPLHSQIRNI